MYTVLASESTSAIGNVVNSMTTSFTSQVSEITSGIGSIVPTLLPIVGVIAVVFIGLKLFRRMAK